MTRQISTYTQQVVDALNAVHTPEQVREGGIEFWHHRFYAMPGVRFDRIVKQSQITSSEEAPTWSNEQRLVLSFVERDTGDIHYSAGWKAPAKWVDGPAVEWHADEAQRYAQFVKDGGWGYQGQRAKWEAEHQSKSVSCPVCKAGVDQPCVHSEVEWPAKAPERFDIKAFATVFYDARLLAKAMPTNTRWQDRLSAHRVAWAALTGTTDNNKQDDEVNAVLDRTGHVAHTSDLT